jgi:hypothetical protein
MNVFFEGFITQVLEDSASGTPFRVDRVDHRRMS